MTKRMIVKSCADDRQPRPRDHSQLYPEKSLFDLESSKINDDERRTTLFVLLKILFERVEDELRSILESYFQSRNLPNKSIVEDSFARLQLVASIGQPNRVEFYSIRDVYLRLRRKTLILLKLILLEKKVG